MRLLVCLSLLLAAGVQPPMRVLFIGNSLTAANDLPGMVETLARAAGRPLDAESIAFPDFSLEDHWNQGDARKAIARGAWDVVVLQQGPSALPESRRLLVDYTRRFDGEIRKAGARTALYMVWPSANRRGDFERVSRSYAAAAEAVKGTLLPVGDAWRAAWKDDTALPLYGPDRFHPSPLATYLGAMVIYRGLTRAPPPARPLLGGATEAQGETLARAAAAVAAP